MEKRVLAVKHIAEDGKSAIVYGEGVIKERAIPPPVIAMSCLGMLVATPVSRIELDNGRVVWGCECMYTATDSIDLSGMTITTADIDKERTKRKRQRLEVNCPSCGMNVRLKSYMSMDESIPESVMAACTNPGCEMHLKEWELSL